MGQVLYLSHQPPKMQPFKTYLELTDYFKDEETCRQYLAEQRWGSNPTCPFCGTDKAYTTTRGYKCRNKECYKKFSVTVGTIYENSKVDLRVWFAVISLCTASKKGISSLQVSRQFGITQKSAWFVLHRVREMLREKAPIMLGNIVAVDETYVGGKEANKHKSKRAPKGATKGRAVDIKTPVFGIVENKGKVVVKVTNLVSKAKAREFIDENVRTGSIMVTDGFAMYAYLKTSKHFVHVVVDHSTGEYVKDGFHTNGIENFWSLLKRGIIGIFHQVSPKHLQRYCDEFAARYNTRTVTDFQRFKIAMRNSAGRLTYNRLIGKP